MKEKIVYLLKHNAVAQFVYKVFFSAAFRFLGLFVKTDENLVLFLSMMGTRYNDSPRSIYEYIKSHHEYENLHCVWAFEHPEEYPEIESVKIDTPKFFILALKAKYWIASTHFERGLKFKKKATQYLYTCHGTAIKLCGNDCPGRKDFDYSNIDIITICSEFDEMVMMRSFKARAESFFRCGRPCNDELWHVTDSEKQQMRAKLEIPDDKKVILYAPTWRDSDNSGATYSIKPPINFEKWEEVLGDKYVVLFRAHQITNEILGVNFNDFVRDCSDYLEVNDLLMATDILISDYSAILTDYAILERPILCFAYDYDEYLISRGTYFDLDEKYPNKICKTETELLNRIITIDFEEEKKNTIRFKNEFDQFGGNATELCVKKLFGH